MSANIINTDELIKYKNYNNIYSICLAYGGFTTVLTTNSYLVLGTKLGVLLIFNYMEFLQLILIPVLHNHKDKQSNLNTNKLNQLWSKNGPVDKIIMSKDGTYLAASYKNGNIFLWNLNDSNKINIQNNNNNNNNNTENTTDSPDDSSSTTTTTQKYLFAVLNITDHLNNTIVGLDFIGNRHTGLIISDLGGNIVYHNGHRSTFWSLNYNSNKLLILPKNEILINTKLNPLSGNFLAVLTNCNLTLLILKPKLNLIYQQDITELVNDNNILLKQNSLIWFKNNLLLSITNKLIIFYNIFNLNGKLDSIKINKFTHELSEPILSVQWINLNLIACLTVSHKFIILNVTNNFKRTLTIDLLPFNLMIPPNKFVIWFDKKIFLLSNYSLIIGEFVTWTTLTLNKVQRGNYIEALNLLNWLMDPNFAYPNLINLSNSIKKRKLQLMEPFNNLIFATLKYLINNNKLIDFELVILMSINLHKEWYPTDYKSKINNFLEIIWDNISSSSASSSTTAITNNTTNTSISVSNDNTSISTNDIITNGTNESIILHNTDSETNSLSQIPTNSNSPNLDLINIFLKTILNLIKLGNITSIPIVLFQKLLITFPEQLNILVFNLPVINWDHDLLIHTCQDLSYLDILIYIWNVSFHDYLTPLVDFIKLIRDGQLTNSEIFANIKLDDIKVKDDNNSKDEKDNNFIIFNYLNSIFQDKQFPTNDLIPDSNAEKIKLNISNLLFNPVDIIWPPNSEEKMLTTPDANEPIYPYTTLFLNFNDTLFLTMINEMLENSFFNDNDDTDTQEIDQYNDSMVFDDNLNQLNPNRQYITTLFIDILKTNELNEPIKINIATCLATNIPKYPQYIHVSNNDIELIIFTIIDSTNLNQNLHHDFENALEAILPLYDSSKTATFVLKLKEQHFNRALFSFYKRNNDFINILNMYFSLDNFDIMNNTDLKTILTMINEKMETNSTDFLKIIDILKKNMSEVLAHVGDTSFLVHFLQKLDPSLHQEILKIHDNDTVVLQFLDELFDTYGLLNFNNETDKKLKKLYIKLVCQYKDIDELIVWINKFDLKKIYIDDLISFLKKSNYIEVIALVYEKLENYKEVIVWTQLGIHNWFKTNKLDHKDGTELDSLSLYRYLELSIKSAIEAKENKKDCWIKIISYLMKEFSLQRNNAKNLDICKNMMQFVFVKLTLSEHDNKEELWDILTGSFEQQDIILSKINDLKDLFSNIFITYHLEKSISETILQIIRDSSSDIIQDYEKKLNEGWTVQNSECHICGKKIWGVGLNPINFLIWESKLRNHECGHITGGIEKQKIILFNCSHIFHTECLRNMGQKKKFFCLMCSNDVNSLQ